MTHEQGTSVIRETIRREAEKKKKSKHLNSLGARAQRRAATNEHGKRGTAVAHSARTVPKEGKINSYVSFEVLLGVPARRADVSRGQPRVL